VSYDFAVIPADLADSIQCAAQLCDEMYQRVNKPAPSRIREFVEELNQRYGFEQGDDRCFLTIDAEADAHGTVVCTSSITADENAYALLEMTKGRDLAVFDPQTLRLYNPRGRVDIAVTLGDGTKLPYLTEHILADLVQRPPRRNPWFVISRSEQRYMQAHLPQDAAAVLEHRVGASDRHYRATTVDPAVVQTLMWHWVIENPAWLTSLPWQRVDI
jgi:hypothetical protein